MKRASTLPFALFCAVLPAWPDGAALGDGLSAPPPLAWRVSTSSPSRDVASDEDAPIYAICGKPDASLSEVAARNAGRIFRGEPPFASDELDFTLRAAGAPEVWPRAWTIEGKGLLASEVDKRVKAWSEASRAVGEARCGVARSVGRDGRTIVGVVEVDALADLDPLPNLTRVGEWVTLRGHMLVPASEVKVVLLGPRGLPKTVLASLSGDDLRATFSVDDPGQWLVQVLGTVETGPRPVLEAYVNAGVDPAQKFAEAPAPGEDATGSGADAASTLVAMVNAARTSEGLAVLARDTTLDKLAAEHDKRMIDEKTVGHDVGDGDPRTRVFAAGLNPRATGENVASASTLGHAHRSLWASPSHRSNILEKRFTSIGVGVLKTPDGRVWVTEIFTG